MWTRIAARGRCRATSASKVGERQAQVLAVAVDELHRRARVQRRQRRGHERVRRAQHGLARARPRTPARPARRPPSPPNATAPSPFQAAHAASKRSVSGPSDQRWRVDDLVPQRVQPRAVALVEADREPVQRRAETARRRPRATGRRPPAPRRPAHASPAATARQRRAAPGRRARPRRRSRGGHGEHDGDARGRPPAAMAQHTVRSRGGRRPSHAKPAGEHERQQQHERADERVVALHVAVDRDERRDPDAASPRSPRPAERRAPSAAAATRARPARAPPRRERGRGRLRAPPLDVAADALRERRRARCQPSSRAARSPLTGAPAKSPARPGTCSISTSPMTIADRLGDLARCVMSSLPTRL